MTKRHLALALATLTLSLPVPAHAKHPAPPQPTLSADKPLPPVDRKHLLGDTFTVVKTVAQIPAPIRTQLVPDANAVDGMADPGERYQTTDVVGAKLLPSRRLILAANSAGYSLIYEEDGGFSYSQALSLYRLTNGTATLVWEAYAHPTQQPFNFEQLRSLIRQYHSPQPVSPQTPVENKHP